MTSDDELAGFDMDADIASSTKIMTLTPKAISAMFRMNGSQDNPAFSPTLQVIHLKKIDNKGGGDERWKVCLIERVIYLDVTAFFSSYTFTS
jgi:hypothetical protein